MHKPLSILWPELRNWAEAVRLTQQEIADQTGLCQSTVQRLLANRPKRYTKALRSICKYAKIDIVSEEKKDITKNSYLINALNTLWDGTPENANALTEVIKAMSKLSKAK